MHAWEAAGSCALGQGERVSNPVQSGPSSSPGAWPPRATLKRLPPGGPGWQGLSLEVKSPGARDVEGLGLACAARSGVEGVHAPAARAHHVRHEAGAVAADVLQDAAVGVHVRELFLHTLPLGPLQGPGAGPGCEQGPIPCVGRWVWERTCGTECIPAKPLPLSPGPSPPSTVSVSHPSPPEPSQTRASGLLGMSQQTGRPACTLAPVTGSVSKEQSTHWKASLLCVVVALAPATL